MRHFPNGLPRRRKVAIDPHLSHPASRWKAGCHTIAQLHRELVALGTPLTYKMVYKQLVRSLPQGRKNAQRPDRLPRPSVLARQAVFLFLRRPKTLEADEQGTLALLQSLHTEAKLAYELVQHFAQMLRTRTGEQLDDWLERVRASKIRELQGCVDFRGTRPAQRCEPDSRFLKTMGWEIGKANKLKRDLAHGLWSGWIREARGNVSFMLSEIT